MSAKENTSAATLEHQIIERYGLLLSQVQLAELLGRSNDGLRCSLYKPSDQSMRALRDCKRKIGRRVYYPASEIARIIMGTDET
jgi:hypothetical protein